MTIIEKLIADEQAKIALFKAKITESENRITVLQSIQTEDPVDIAAGEAISASSNILNNIAKYTKRPVTHTEDSAFPKRKLGEVIMVALQETATGKKSFDQIQKAVDASGKDSSRHNTRAILKTFMDNYEFFTSPKKGFYEITQNGLKYLEAQKGESPATANSGAFSLQPASSQGASTKGVRHGIGTAARTTSH